MAKKRFEELGWDMFQFRDFAFVVYNGKIYVGLHKNDFHSEIIRRIIEENNIQTDAVNNQVAFGYLYHEENGPCAIFHANKYYDAFFITKRVLKCPVYTTFEEGGYLHFKRAL